MGWWTKSLPGKNATGNHQKLPSTKQKLVVDGISKCSDFITISSSQLFWASKIYRPICCGSISEYNKGVWTLWLTRQMAMFLSKNFLGGGFKHLFCCFYSIVPGEKWSNLTNLFQIGWNHELVFLFWNHAGQNVEICTYIAEGLQKTISALAHWQNQWKVEISIITSLSPAGNLRWSLGESHILHTPRIVHLPFKRIALSRLVSWCH